MITAVILAAGCLFVAWHLGKLSRSAPKVQRRASRRPLRGDLWLWEQEWRRNGSDR